MTEQQDEAALRTVQIMIKSPNGSDKDFCLTMPLDDTRVRDVKRLLHEQHPEHPAPGDQRLIFAGKLLTDDSLTADVLKQVRSTLAWLQGCWGGLT